MLEVTVDPSTQDVLHAELLCDYCSEPLLPLLSDKDPYHLTNGAGEFCSEECRWRWEGREHYDATSHPYYGESLGDGFSILGLSYDEEEE